MNILLVFLGGGLGSVLRYLVKVFCEKNLIGVFPYSTFSVNILGSFFIGFVCALVFYKTSLISPQLKLFLTVGVAGGFTTFSSYSFEVVELFKNGHFIAGCVYSVLSVIISLAAVICGVLSAKYIGS